MTGADVSQLAIRIGKATARAWFKARGNRSEAHLSEVELAALLALAAQAGIGREIPKFDRGPR